MAVQAEMEWVGNDQRREGRTREPSRPHRACALLIQLRYGQEERL